MDENQGGTSSSSMRWLRVSLGGDKTRRAFQAGEEKGKEGEKLMRATEQSSPEPSSLYLLAELGDITHSSKCLCQPLLPAGAPPREELSPGQSQETRRNLSIQGTCVAPSPAKQPGQQQKEASEGHALAELEARVPCTQPCSAQGDLHRLWAGLCPTHAARCNSCRAEPAGAARSWPDRRPTMAGAPWRVTALGSTQTEQLKDTENTLSGAYRCGH